MRHETRILAVLALGATFAVGACGRSHDDGRTTPSPAPQPELSSSTNGTSTTADSKILVKT
jgi:hypothetical protein